MFDPKMLSELKERYLAICDVSMIDENKNNKESIYTSYFLILEKISQLENIDQEIKNYVEEVKPFITHKNADLRELLYNCYQTLKKMNDNTPSNIEKLIQSKVSAIESFNSLFESSEGVR